MGSSILLIVLCFKPADNYTPTISFIHNNYTSYKTQVFYTDNNPYDKNNCLNFFKPRDLSVHQISIDTLTYIDLNKYSHSLVVASKDEIRKIKMRGFEVKKVYSTIPDFLYSINFNDWISRTTKTEIYELSINPYIR